METPSRTSKIERASGCTLIIDALGRRCRSGGPLMSLYILQLVLLEGVWIYMILWNIHEVM